MEMLFKVGLLASSRSAHNSTATPGWNMPLTSMCSQMPCLSQTSAISFSGSNAPTTVVPEVATTAMGCLPCRESEHNEMSAREDGRRHSRWKGREGEEGGEL